MKRWLVISAPLLLLFAVACGNSSDKQPQKAAAHSRDNVLAEKGKEMFYSADFGYTGVACADCHADFDDGLEKDRILPGHSILGAASRVATWNGEFSGEALKRTAAGAAKCAHLYQDRGQSVEGAITGPEAAALMEFFRYISTGEEAPRLEWRAVTWPGDPNFNRDSFDAAMLEIARMRGDAARGKVMFERACSACHGTDIGPAPVMLRRKVDRVAATVRRGAEGMPFFSTDKVSDQDIADITAWIQAGAQ
jgi:mono/diheme cytochrome c family protein